MARNKNTGEKTTATKPERRHANAVDNAIKHNSTNDARSHATFAHLSRSIQRYDKRSR